MGLAAWFARLRVLRDWWRPAITAAILCTVMLLLNPSDQFDRQLSDVVLTSRGDPVDPAILIVEIKPEDVRKYGGPPFGRKGLVAILNHLADAGAERVLLDHFVGDTFDPEIDRQLEKAMARFGPQRLALTSGTTPAEHPLENFARYATVVDSRLTPDTDGWHRRLGTGGADFGNNPAYWLATGKAASGLIPFDLRIDSNRYDRRSAIELMQSHDSLKGRVVVISAGVRVAPSRAMLPGNRPVSRASVLAIGTQSVGMGYIANYNTGHQANRVLFIVAVLLGLACAITAKSGRMIVVLSVLSCTMLAALAIAIGLELGVEMLPFRTTGGFLVMVNVTLIQRLRILPMMGSFLKGDISPEEVWAWRSYEQAASPALLLSFDGRVKRSNPAAADLIGWNGEQLTRQCLQYRGQDDGLIELAVEDRHARTYRVEWPVAQAPIVVLRDVTETESEQRELRKQLFTDELTGFANRRGFDHALRDASELGAPYAVYFLDMNGFKAVNDTFGHDAGDELLVQTAARLSETVRPGDTVARLGGDEFAVVVRGSMDEARAASLAGRMEAAVKRPYALGSAGRDVSVGIAVGYARSEDAGIEPAELLRQADKAMYRNKIQSKLKAAA